MERDIIPGSAINFDNSKISLLNTTVFGKRDTTQMSCRLYWWMNMVELCNMHPVQLGCEINTAVCVYLIIYKAYIIISPYASGDILVLVSSRPRLPCPQVIYERDNSKTKVQNFMKL